MAFTEHHTVIQVEVRQGIHHQDFQVAEVILGVILDFLLCLDKIHTLGIQVYIQEVSHRVEKVCKKILVLKVVKFYQLFPRSY